MSPPLTFMMGQFEAELPTDRQYAKNHMWAQSLESTDTFRFGFSAYAVRLLQEVYFLDWDVEAKAALARGRAIGYIESKKAESDLYAPIDGTLTEMNDALMDDPSLINRDPYGAAWLFAIEGSGDELMTPQQYVDHLAATWPATQRRLKMQVNE